LQTYGIEIWSDNNFFIEGEDVKLNFKSSPTLLEITQNIRQKNIRGPLLLRFPHLIQKQIDTLFSHFHHSIEENSYRGNFCAVFPLKVNQHSEVIDTITRFGSRYNYGLEAGSKAELIIAMSKSQNNAPITVNGFKDTEMIELGFMAAHMEKNITLTIEGINELESIIEVANNSHLQVPNIGIRIRLNSSGSGIWAKSGGMGAKFGLTTTELLEAFTLLKKSNLLDKFHMIHFHIGSQMEDIAPLKKALREAGNIYAELKKMGADALTSVNIGGGVAVEYAQHEHKTIKNYSIEEFSSDVVFVLKQIMDTKEVAHPNIFTESGRYIVASHAVLISPVLELFSQDFQLKSLKLKEKNPPLIKELYELYTSLNKKNAMEYLHDSLDHLESLFSLFELGYIDLQDRSNAEILTHLIIKKTLYLFHNGKNRELIKLDKKLQERYLLNCSFFQSLPDYWGLQQHFPVMPISHLNQAAIRPASLWDITCDSDGEIEFNTDEPLYLHDIDLDEEEYFLAFFNVGAYQETLGMNHNLFTHPNEIVINIDERNYEISSIKEAQSILSVLDTLSYDTRQILDKLKTTLHKQDFITEEEKSATLSRLEIYLKQNSYLRTTN